MMKHDDVSGACAHHIPKRICWSAIFTGAIVAIGLSFLLNLLGIALGLTMFTAAGEGAMAIAVSGIIAILVGIIVTMFIAGYTAGSLGRCHCPDRSLGCLYGFTTWTAAILLSALLGSHVHNYVNDYSNTLSPSVQVQANSNNTNATTSETKASSKHVNTSAMMVKVNASAMAWAALGIFVLFLIGAISACIGGCCGMRCKKDTCS